MWSERDRSKSLKIGNLYTMSILQAGADFPIAWRATDGQKICVARHFCVGQKICVGGIAPKEHRNLCSVKPAT